MGARAQRGRGRAPEVRPADLHCSILKFTTSGAELKAADISNFIVSVPTSIEGERRPDLGAAAQSLGDMGKVMRKGDRRLSPRSIRAVTRKTAAGARAAFRLDVTPPWAIA
jgi:hypothetical protein